MGSVLDQDTSKDPTRSTRTILLTNKHKINDLESNVSVADVFKYTKLFWRNSSEFIN